MVEMVKIIKKDLLTTLIVLLIKSAHNYGIQGNLLNTGSEDDNLILQCDGTAYGFHSKEEKFIKYDSKLKEVQINNCPLPPYSYSSVLEDSINISMVNGIDLIISTYSIDSDLQAEHFRGLFLKYLEIIYGYETGIGRPNKGFLEPLTQLTQLTVGNAMLPPLPSNSVLKYLILHHGSFEDSIGGCKELIYIFLQQWVMHDVSSLTLCRNLESLHLENIAPQTVNEILRAANRVESVTITQCNLLHLPAGIFDNMLNLRELDLDINELNIIYFDAPPSLRTLSITNNFFQNNTQNSVLKSNLPKLQELFLEYNNFFKLCEMFYSADNVATVYPELKKLVLSETSIDFECINRTNVPVLNELYMEEYDNSIFKFQNLLHWQVPLYINLLKNKINEVIFSKTDYETLRISKSNITMFGDIILKCDCHHAYFAQALRERLLIFVKSSDVICEDMDRKYLKETYPNQTECTKVQCGDCVCVTFWSSGATTADCRGATATRIPQAEGLQTLLAPDNRIQLREEDIPDTLTFLDLTRNNILSIDEPVWKKLFSINRTILFEDNYFLCDCEHKQFIEALQANYQQIRDYANLKCTGEKNVLIHDAMNLCVDNTPFVSSLATSATLLALITVGFILNYSYGQEIRVFLYARGWCLFCFSEEDDVDRSYDAFVSFCHENEPFVSEEFVPQLEELGYKICVHYRDWILGDMIPNQIVRSVEASRRTIIVLSKDFVHSLWGSLEFKTAHARALKEGVPRVILIVIDDVIDLDDLDEDLRSYIRTNTYVTLGDPWFWDKLQYAMRRRRGWKRLGRNDTINISTDGVPNVVITPLAIT